MKTTKITELEMPDFIPHGWQKEVALRLGLHRNTVYKIKIEGESHPLYPKMKKVLIELYGKPIK